MKNYQLTKAEALRDFREMWDDLLRREPRWRGDTIAKREEWNNYVDALQKDGRITQRQADTWDNPF